MDKLLYVIGGTAWINLVNTTYNSNKQKIDILADT
ncbi:CGNR zinc finger domain-containing protein, partial [Salibacterium salarium]